MNSSVICLKRYETENVDSQQIHLVGLEFRLVCLKPALQPIYFGNGKHNAEVIRKPFEDKICANVPRIANNVSSKQWANLFELESWKVT